MQQVVKWLGKEHWSSVFKAALLGVPLPLCSCAVIPAAVELRKSGAGRGATSSFLISTPESGIDSISVTYALMGLPMAILRPVAAFLSAFVAGLLQLILNPEKEIKKVEVQAEVKSCCAHKKKQDSPGDSHDHSHQHAHAHESHGSTSSFSNFWLVKSLKYAFVDLIDDMAVWFSLGMVLAALVDTFVPPAVFVTLTGHWGKLAIMALAVPIYICASATTPLAAAMMLKGLSPGSALLLMLLGPATNLSNLLVMQKYIGKKAVIINLVAICLCAWAMAIASDHFFPLWGLDNVTMGLSPDHARHTPHVVEILCALLLSGLLLKGLYKEAKEKWGPSKKASCH